MGKSGDRGLNGLAALGKSWETSLFTQERSAFNETCLPKGYSSGKNQGTEPTEGHRQTRPMHRRRRKDKREGYESKEEHEQGRPPEEPAQTSPTTTTNSGPPPRTPPPTQETHFNPKSPAQLNRLIRIWLLNGGLLYSSVYTV